MDCSNGMGSNGSGDKVGFISFQADEGVNAVGRDGVSKPTAHSKPVQILPR